MSIWYIQCKCRSSKSFSMLKQALLCFPTSTAYMHLSLTVTISKFEVTTAGLIRDGKSPDLNNFSHPVAESKPTHFPLHLLTYLARWKLVTRLHQNLLLKWNEAMKPFQHLQRVIALFSISQTDVRRCSAMILVSAVIELLSICYPKVHVLVVESIDKVWYKVQH